MFWTVHLYVFLRMNICLCVWIYLSICLPVHLFISLLVLFLCLSAYFPACMHACLQASIFLSVSLFVRLFGCLHICISAYLPTSCLSICQCVCWGKSAGIFRIFLQNWLICRCFQKLIVNPYKTKICLEAKNRTSFGCILRTRITHSKRHYFSLLCAIL